MGKVFSTISNEIVFHAGTSTVASEYLSALMNHWGNLQRGALLRQKTDGSRCQWMAAVVLFILSFSVIPHKTDRRTVLLFLQAAMLLSTLTYWNGCWIIVSLFRSIRYWRVCHFYVLIYLDVVALRLENKGMFSPLRSL